MTYRDANPWGHRLLSFLRYQAGIQLDEIWMLVHMAKRFGNARVGIDVFKLLIRLQSEMLPELVKTSNVPLATLDDTQDLDRLHGLRHIATTESSGTVLDSFRNALDEFVIAKLTIGTALEATEHALRWVGGDALVELHEALGHVLGRYGTGVLTEYVAEELLDPLVVLVGDVGMPSIRKVVLCELNTIYHSTYFEPPRIYALCGTHL